MHDNSKQESSEKTNSTLVSLRDAAEQHSKNEIQKMQEVFTLTAEDLDERKIIHPKMRDKRILNVFRELRTKLVSRAKETNFSVLVTSICEGGGATFITRNLAAAFALDHGKTSVLIDCNLYSPSDSGLVDDAELGFSDFLENPAVSVEEVIYATGVPRLRVVPAGTATDIGPEYYTSYRMKQFIEELGDRYSDRFVFLDAPPIGSVTDARILSDYCDFVIVVVPYGMATKEQINSAVESIPTDKFFGLVFNH